MEDTHQQVIPHAHARTIATYWLDEHHADEPVTVLAVTGAIAEDTADHLEHDLRQLELATAREADVPVMAQAQLTALLGYVQSYGPRGPVPGWSELPDDDPWSRGLIPLRAQRGQRAETERDARDHDDHRTLYERIGGGRGVGQVVETLYRTVLADPALAAYFDGIDIGRVKAHQYAFINNAAGGPDYYAGRSLRRAHSGLGITDEHFDRLLDHLVGSLEGRGISQQEIDVIAGKLACFRDEVVDSD